MSETIQTFDEWFKGQFGQLPATIELKMKDEKELKRALETAEFLQTRLSFNERLRCQYSAALYSYQAFKGETK